MYKLLCRSSALFLALILAITPAIASELPSNPIETEPIISTAATEEISREPVEETPVIDEVFVPEMDEELSNEVVEAPAPDNGQPSEEIPAEQPVVEDGDLEAPAELPEQPSVKPENTIEQPEVTEQPVTEVPAEQPEIPVVPEVPVVPEIPVLPPKAEPLPPIVLTEDDIIEEFGLENPLHANRNGSIQYEAGNTVDFFFPETINGVGVKSISNWAFFGNEVFSTVIIPACITEIGNFAFGNCPNLKYIILMDRSDTSDMILGKRWYGDAEVIFGITIPEQEELPEIMQEELLEIVQEPLETEQEIPVVEEKLPEIKQEISAIEEEPPEIKQEIPAMQEEPPVVEQVPIVEAEGSEEIVANETQEERREEGVEETLPVNEDSAIVPKQDDVIPQEPKPAIKTGEIVEDLL